MALILTGGTIDSLGASRLDLAWYPDHGRRLAAGALVAAVPELAEFGTVREIPFRRLSSHALTSADWLDLARTVQTLLDRADCDGVVITHGTNTLEETAYFLRLTVNSDKPVVLTGAMRPASALGADGYLNLVRAVQVAAAPQARGRGVLVVMNDRIHDARDVTKASTMRVDAFVAPDSGPLGSTDTDGLVVFSRERTHPDSPIFTLPDVLPRVDIVLSYVDADGVFVEAAVAAGAKGIVCAATGAGWPTPLQQTALERAAANNVVVCFASRTGSGRVPHPVPGRVITAVTADSLSPWKAKVLLALALTRTTDLGAIQHLFDHS
ncbi:asparaginase [Fodinicola feengrottensis]|uniref:asparaginase n=1 Tax=Fodinicola feengrottensis TaxID=435914 RepID=UPI0031DAE0FC